MQTSINKIVSAIGLSSGQVLHLLTHLIAPHKCNVFAAYTAYDPADILHRLFHGNRVVADVHFGFAAVHYFDGLFHTPPPKKCYAVVGLSVYCGRFVCLLW